MSEPAKKSKRYNRRLYISRHVESHANEEGWLISYADMMTLLFGFFVILYSTSKADKHKYDEMSEALAKQFQTQEPAKPQAPPPVPASSKFTSVLKADLIKNGLDSRDVELVDDGKSLTISLRGKASFDSGKIQISPQGENFVNSVAYYLSTSKLPYEVRVEGHTDDAAIQSTAYPTNWELSAARAAGVAHAMVDLGLPADRVIASGFSSSRPLVPNRDPAGIAIPDNMAKNRRVMIIVAFPETPSAADIQNLKKLGGGGL